MVTPSLGALLPPWAPWLVLYLQPEVPLATEAVRPCPTSALSQDPTSLGGSTRSPEAWCGRGRLSHSEQASPTAIPTSPLKFGRTLLQLSGPLHPPQTQGWFLPLSLGASWPLAACPAHGPLSPPSKPCSLSLEKHSHGSACIPSGCPLQEGSWAWGLYPSAWHGVFGTQHTVGAQWVFGE